MGSSGCGAAKVKKKNLLLRIRNDQKCKVWEELVGMEAKKSMWAWSNPGGKGTEKKIIPHGEIDDLCFKNICKVVHSFVLLSQKSAQYFSEEYHV